MFYKLTENSAPAIYELHGRRDIPKLRNAFIRLLRLMLLMVLPLATGVFLFNRDLVIAWVGQRQYAGKLLTVTLGIYCIIKSLQGLAILFSFVFGWVRLLAVTSLLQGIANFGLGYYLGKTLGLGGITLAMLLVLAPQLIILLYKLNAALEITIMVDLLRIVRRLIFPLACACLASLPVHYMVHVSHHHYSGFLLEFFAFTAVYLGIAYRFGMVEQDRNDVRRYLTAILIRGRIIQRG